MPLLISDSNILIDFESGGILTKLFQLSHTLAVSDILFEEELRERHSNLPELGLQQLELKPGSMLRIVELASLYRRPSRIDLSALALAEQEKCVLLTGDNHLRKAAEAEKTVEVHGTLWVCDLLVKDEVLDVAALDAAYSVMKQHGRRLPWSEVSRQLARLRENQR